MIGDTETRHIYQELVRRAVEFGPFRLEYRCDAPDQRRFMAMVIEHERDKARIAFVNQVLRVEARSFQALIDATRERSEQRFLRLCSWCKKAQLTAQDWVEIEQAVERLRLFDDAPLPRLTHGICPGCQETVRKVYR